MPQASDGDREQMVQWFGSNDSQGPVQFLTSHGYKLTKKWTWELPVPYHGVSCYELACIYFLVHEWDFGSIENDNDRKVVCLCGCRL